VVENLVVAESLLAAALAVMVIGPGRSVLLVWAHALLWALFATAILLAVLACVRLLLALARRARVADQQSSRGAFALLALFLLPVAAYLLAIALAVALGYSTWLSNAVGVLFLPALLGGIAALWMTYRLVCDVRREVHRRAPTVVAH